jgi:ketosteroid isomerase-like protein
MSQENVEVVRAAYEMWNAGDMVSLRERYDPDVLIVRGLEGWPEGSQPTVGREAVMQLFEYVRQAWDADTLEPISFLDAADRVVVRQIWHGTGRGPQLKLEWTVIYTLRKGRIFLMEYFWDHAEALEAVGLSE